MKQPQEPSVEIKSTVDITEMISSPARRRAERELIGALLLWNYFFYVVYGDAKDLR